MNTCDSLPDTSDSLPDTSDNMIKAIDTEPLINTIMMQTDYNKEEALKKLTLFNNDAISVIRDYLGTNTKKENKKSLNQKIYREIRHHLYLSILSILSILKFVLFF